MSTGRFLPMVHKLDNHTRRIIFHRQHPLLLPVVIYWGSNRIIQLCRCILTWLSRYCNTGDGSLISIQSLHCLWILCPAQYRRGIWFNNGYTGPNNRASNDVFFRYTTGACRFYNCWYLWRWFDTYLHILDANGVHITSMDDGPRCGQQTVMVFDAPSTTYYIVLEGWNTSSGYAVLAYVNIWICSIQLTLHPLLTPCFVVTNLLPSQQPQDKIIFGVMEAIHSRLLSISPENTVYGFMTMWVV